MLDSIIGLINLLNIIPCASPNRFGENTIFGNIFLCVASYRCIILLLTNIPYPCGKSIFSVAMQQLVLPSFTYIICCYTYSFLLGREINPGIIKLNLLLPQNIKKEKSLLYNQLLEKYID